MIYPSPKKYSRKIMGYVKKKEKKRHIAHVSKISKRREDKIMQKRSSFSIHYIHTHAHLDQVV
jgi:hypothetical protein